ncbi:MAG TPA: hypothetical protein DCY13_14610 [Verrucomicrobiales bacterium]|nr:hypothetical protein [Verrucomicrobiales bacterium]
MRQRLVYLLNAISPSCRDAVRMLAESRRRPHPFPRRMGLRLHLLLCGFCRRYRTQLERLKALLADEDPAPNEVRLTPEARQRIKERLRPLIGRKTEEAERDACCGS